MAVRTTKTAVRLILKTSLSDDQIDAFIADASAWVDANLQGETGVTSAIAEGVEKYLAAHLITLRDPLLTERKRDDITDRFGLRTTYLEFAAKLDPTGTVEEQFGEERPAFGVTVGAGYDDDLTKLGTSVG